MSAPDSATVREFLHIVTAQAKAAIEGEDNPGFLQLSRLHPDSEELVPTRFMLDDVERMIATAVSDAENGHNVYIEGRLVRPGLRGKERGKFADTTAVFALVVDSDNDKGMGWEPNVPVSLTVETSPSNFHHWFFLRQAVSAEVGKQLGERIRAAVNCDHDSGNPVQPYRIAGTVNYPSKQKRARGRVTVETRIIAFDPEVLWTADDIERAFPLPEREPTNGSGGNAGDAQPDEGNIPADTMQVIRDGVEDGQRSGAFWNVMLVLKRRSFTVDSIIALLETHPNGIAKKYRGRLRDEVERAYGKIDQGQQDGAQAAAAPETAPEIVFDPWAQYVVPAFPFEILPPLVRDYVAAQAAVTGCDPSAVAMCTLGTFSGALHHGFALKMLRHGGWYANPRLWVLLVGDVSRRKTPSIKGTVSPLVLYEAHLRVKYEHDLRDYEQAKAEGDHASKPQELELPQRYVVWDTTVEKLGELLARGDGRKGLLVLAEEISGWLGSMERYAAAGARSDRAFWLQAYDGGPYSVERIKRGELFIKNLSVSLIGGIQPTRLAELIGLASDGLLQRFLPLMMGSANFPQDRPTDDENYSKFVREMIFAKPARLIMDDAALAAMTDLQAHLFDLEQASAGLASGFQGFIGKLHGVAGSLALILHLAHDAQLSPTVPIDIRTVENIGRLVLDFILPHAREFYCGAGTADGERLRRLASWILTAGKDRIVASDLSTNVADCRGLTVFEVNQRVSPLVAAGWLTPADKTPVCRSWQVAPQVHVQLAERARMEEERKVALAALMGSPRRTKEQP